MIVQPTVMRCSLTGAREAYDAFAPAYDAYTVDYAYDRWLAAVLEIATELGLRGREVLDAACGTANSSLPLIERGYAVTGCDLSPAMIAAARRKLAEPERVGIADLRALPFVERFDLTTCLDDGLNYLLGERDLRRGLSSLARGLRRGGVLAFDLNTMPTLQAAYGSDSDLELGDWRYRWRGRTPAAGLTDGVAMAELAVSRRRRDRRGWRWRELGRAVHRQAHHDEGRVRDAAAAAGLEVVAVLGQSPGVVLSDTLDERRHTKALYFARRPRRRARRTPPRRRPKEVSSMADHIRP